MAKKYADYSKDELIAEIKKLKKHKKYGLVWEAERTKEKFEAEAENSFPVLQEIANKEIKGDTDSPVNIMIEGDNYHALAVLNYTHKGKVDVIYIDPPYNTGKANEFKYNDKWVEETDNYRHSKWLSFMEKRLQLAKDLLKETGVIFISIDDNEQAQLKLLCDEVFGEENMIGNIVWHKKSQPSFLSKEVINVTEYILVYKITSIKIPFKGGFADKNKLVELLNISNPLSKRIFHKEFINIQNDYSGNLKAGEYGKGDLKVMLINDIVVKNGKPLTNIEMEGRFRWAQDMIDETCDLGALVYFKTIKSMRATLKRNDDIDRIKGPISLFSKYVNLTPTNTDATNELKEIFDGISPMDNPKPTMLIKYILEAITYNKPFAIILDFFAGSGTTGHAVMELNKEDGGNRQFIVCTNNENNIATEVCYPRLEKTMKTGYGDVAPLGGNLKYYKTAFVPAASTDGNKIKLTQKATDMLCLRENTFEKVIDKPNFKIYKNNKYHTGIIWHESAIDEFKKTIKTIKGKFHVYVFSFGDDVFAEEFEDIKSKVSLKPIPEAILKIYRKIFKLT